MAKIQPQEPRFSTMDIRDIREHCVSGAKDDYCQGWIGIVDEERGGIIAYFGDEKDAADYIAFRNKK